MVRHKIQRCNESIECISTCQAMIVYKYVGICSHAHMYIKYDVHSNGIMHRIKLLKKYLQVTCNI